MNLAFSSPRWCLGLSKMPKQLRIGPTSLDFHFFLSSKENKEKWIRHDSDILAAFVPIWLVSICEGIKLDPFSLFLPFMSFCEFQHLFSYTYPNMVFPSFLLHLILSTPQELNYNFASNVDTICINFSSKKTCKTIFFFN